MGGGPDVLQQDDVLQGAQFLGEAGLGRKDVERRACDGTGLQRTGQRLAIHGASPGHIDQVAAGAQLGNDIGRHQVLGVPHHPRPRSSGSPTIAPAP